jgi:DNA (cytosine-5)-methyltransferase 1
VQLIKRQEPLLAIDVFSGCGGLTTGLRDSGFRILAGVENDEAARTAYLMNHPGVPLFGDVTKLQATEILEALHLLRGDLDLLAGCSPCQGFSRLRTGNRRQAAEDERNDLVLHFVRLAEGLLPKTILFENVPGLLLDWRFEEMESRLAKDFSLDYHTVDMVDYGVPQRRRRLVLVGSRLGTLDLPQPKGPKLTVRSAIASLPEPERSSDPIHRSLSVHSEAVMQRIKRIPKDGGSRMDLGPEAQLPCHKKIDGYRDVYGRMAFDKPAPTVTRYSTNPSKGRYLHPIEDREITLREVSLLQTFPPDYQFPLEKFGRGAVASMIGDALPPRFAEQLGAHIRRHLLIACGETSEEV